MAASGRSVSSLVETMVGNSVRAETGRTRSARTKPVAFRARRRDRRKEEAAKIITRTQRWATVRGMRVRTDVFAPSRLSIVMTLTCRDGLPSAPEMQSLKKYGQIWAAQWLGRLFSRSPLALLTGD